MPPEASATINLSNRNILEKYADARLRCLPYHLHYSGMDLRSTSLKIDKHYLSFVPYMLSLKNCLLLMPRNAREMDCHRYLDLAIDFNPYLADIMSPFLSY